MTNARNLLASEVRANGDDSTLKDAGAGGDLPKYTPLSPIINRAVNAIGNGDMAGFQKAYYEAVQMKTQDGEAKPEQAVLKMIQARNPVSSTFKKRPSEVELAQILSQMPDYQREVVQRAMSNFQTAIESVGGKAAFSQEQIVANRAGEGGTGAAFPAFAAPRVSGISSPGGRISLGTGRSAALGPRMGGYGGGRLRMAGGRSKRFVRGRLRIRSGRIGRIRRLGSRISRVRSPKVRFTV
jgi:hypothetical protein